MPSGNAGASRPNLPAELIPDLQEFEAALEHWLGQVPARRDAFPDGARERLIAFGRLLHEKAGGTSLIAKGDRPHVFTRHILDSLNPLSLFDEAPESALDIGSGGGLPGIPLAIVWPHTRVLLVESRERKAGFLELAARSMRLTNVRVLSNRIEDVGGRWRADHVASVFVRALAGLPSLLDHASRAAAPGARWVYFLGARSAGAAGGDGGAGVNGGEFGGEVAAGAFGGRLLTGRFP